MMRISFKPTFIRRYKKLDPRLQKEVDEKIEAFRAEKNHASLKVHKLHGVLKNFYSFSVNFKTRIVFAYVDKNEVVLMSVGDHDVYDT